VHRLTFKCSRGQKRPSAIDDAWVQSAKCWPEKIRACYLLIVFDPPKPRYGAFFAAGFQVSPDRPNGLLAQTYLKSWHENTATASTSATHRGDSIHIHFGTAPLALDRIGHASAIGIDLALVRSRIHITRNNMRSGALKALTRA
jgi:hypothetical protein